MEVQIKPASSSGAVCPPPPPPPSVSVSVCVALDWVRVRVMHDPSCRLLSPSSTSRREEGRKRKRHASTLNSAKPTGADNLHMMPALDGRGMQSLYKNDSNIAWCSRET